MNTFRVDVWVEEAAAAVRREHCCSASDMEIWGRRTAATGTTCVCKGGGKEERMRRNGSRQLVKALLNDGRPSADVLTSGTVIHMTMC